MLQQTFQFSLNYDIVPGLVVSAHLYQDSPTAVLVCVTTIGKVLIYTPRLSGEQKNQSAIQFLNLNKKIKKIAVSTYKSEGSPSDKLLLASENTLIAYDVEKNLDLFYKEIQDGISTIAYGQMAWGQKPYQVRELSFVGGDCSIQGFDEKGEESYWNITGDHVTCIWLQPGLAEKPPYLLVASADMAIRVFLSEELIFELQLNSIPEHILGLSYPEMLIFAFATENGTVGVYKQEKLLWQCKDSKKVISLVQGSWDADSPDNFKPILVGREDGTIELRRDLTGDLVYKHQSFGPKLAALLSEDLRGTHTQQLIAVYTDGSIRGLTLGLKDSQSQIQDNNKLNEQVEQFNEKKNELLSRIAAFTQKGSEGLAVLPKGTQVLIGFGMNPMMKCLDLVVKSTNEQTYIKQVILFADSLFLPSECYVYTEQQPASMIRIPLIMVEGNVRQEIRAKVLLSSNPNSGQYQVLEAKHSLPRFSNFSYIETPRQATKPQGFLHATIKERIVRYVKWLDQCFVVDDKILQRLEQQEELVIYFQHTKTLEILSFEINSSKGKFSLFTNSIDLAGEVIQDLSNFMNLSDLNTTAEFPLAMETLKKAIQDVELYKSAKLQISADVAESINKIKAMIVQAEDSRMIGTLSTMKKMYAGVMVENKSLQTEMNKKSQNNDKLMEALREINGMISRGGDLRVGVSKTQVTTLSRNAVKKNNLYQLINIIQYGKEM